MKAYIITKEWWTSDNKYRKEVISILSYRRHSNFYKGYMIQLFADMYADYDFNFRLERVKYNRPRHDVFQIQYMDGGYRIGHDIILFGRLVNNIRAELNETGSKIMVWDEIKRPSQRGP